MTWTLAPAAAIARQAAAPIPLPPPVTSTVLPEKSAIASSTLDRIGNFAANNRSVVISAKAGIQGNRDVARPCPPLSRG
jgi:hypothetical protein